MKIAKCMEEAKTVLYDHVITPSSWIFFLCFLFWKCQKEFKKKSNILFTFLSFITEKYTK